MNESFEKFNTSWNNERLDQHEKAIIRARVQSYMSSKPSPAAFAPVTSPWSIVSVFRDFHVRLVPATLVVALLLGSAISAAAEETVPGDLLYVVKTTINEGAQGMLAISAESEVRYSARIAGRRLAETERLAVEKRLTPEVQEDLNTRFSKHASIVTEGVKQLEEDNKLEAAVSVASDFESSLAAHVVAFEKIAAVDTSVQTTLEDATKSVAAEVETVATARQNVEEKVREVKSSKSKKSAEESLASLEAAFREFSLLLEPIEDAPATDVTGATSTATTTSTTTAVTESLSGGAAGTEPDVSDEPAALVLTAAGTLSEESADIKEQINGAKEAYTIGAERLESGRYGAALVEFERAKRILEAAKSAVATEPEVTVGE